VILEIYELGIENKEILNFSNTLNEAVISIKNEDKSKSLENLTNLYVGLTKFSNIVDSNNPKTHIYATKASVLKAYALVSVDAWEDVKGMIGEAEMNYNKALANSEFIEEKGNSSNSIYILIKELGNCVELKDKELFFMKYKKLIENL
jgi:hypothetical protein